jgi:hypothetical protein
MAVVFRTSGIFAETLARAVQREPRIAERLLDFRKVKTLDPLSAFGKSDSSLSPPFSKLVPGLRHAHLTQDTSVFYTLEGTDPREIRLYGVFNHAESGTGDTPNIRRQKNLAQVLQNQNFPR